MRSLEEDKFRGEYRRCAPLVRPSQCDESARAQDVIVGDDAGAEASQSEQAASARAARA